MFVSPVVVKTPESSHPVYLTPPSSASSDDQEEGSKRGRPRADVIQCLISRGSVAESDIRCKVCNRVFPRDKSLQAHMRTHTGSISQLT